MAKRHVPVRKRSSRAGVLTSAERYHHAVLATNNERQLGALVIDVVVAALTIGLIVVYAFVNAPKALPMDQGMGDPTALRDGSATGPR